MKVTAAMLADAAVVENGKLYIHGGGWDSIHAQALPVTHPMLALAWIFRVEYDEALSDINFAVELLDEDGNPHLIRLEATMRTGHSPHLKRGQSTFIPHAVQLPNLQFPKAGGYEFRISSDENILASVPFRIATAPR